MSDTVNRVEMELVDVMSGYTAEQSREYMERAEKAAADAEATYENIENVISEALTEGATKAAEEAAAAATEKAEEAAQKAEEALAQAQTAAETAAQAAAEEAEKLVDEVVNAAAEKLEDELKNYTAVGAVDLNEQYEYARLYVDADSANAPTDTEKFFVDVDVETNGEKVRQKATGAATGATWLRNGTINAETEPGVEEPEPDDEPTTLEPATGTLTVDGDLSADITVNGSIQVTGTISGDVAASGTITYGELTGTAEGESELESCDVEVEGELSFAAGIDEVEGVYHTTGTVTLTGAATLNADMTVEVESEEEEDTATALENNGTLTVNAALRLYGEVTGEGSFAGTGTVYVNDELVYDGTPEPEVVEPVTWNEWTQGLYGLKVGEDGTITTGGGLSITAEGHIVLPGGVEIY